MKEVVCENQSKIKKSKSENEYGFQNINTCLCARGRAWCRWSLARASTHLEWYVDIQRRPSPRVILLQGLCEYVCMHVCVCLWVLVVVSTKARAPHLQHLGVSECVCVCMYACVCECWLLWVQKQEPPPAAPRGHRVTSTECERWEFSLATLGFARLTTHNDICTH